MLVVAGEGSECMCRERAPWSGNETNPGRGEEALEKSQSCAHVYRIANEKVLCVWVVSGWARVSSRSASQPGHSVLFLVCSQIYAMTAVTGSRTCRLNSATHVWASDD